MGIFDAVKNRLGRKDQEEYYEDDQYYDDDYQGDDHYDDTYREDTYEEPSYEEDYQRGSAESAPAPTSRTGSVFDGFTPLVSMSDVRSQELPPYTERSSLSSSRTRATNNEIKTSLPYVDSQTQGLGSRAQDPEANATGQLTSVRASEGQGYDQVYSSRDSSDPLLKRHSLSNTGDFSTTSPAYYASRSGVGHVRPAGQARRTHKFREAIVIRPENYAEAEQVAINLRRGNAVVLVLTQTRPELAKRILDFSFGAAAVADGQVESIGERIYALTTEHPLTEAEVELLQARGII